jgi:antitoxin HicB
MKQETVMNKDLDYYLKLPYPVTVVQDEDGSWFAEIPLLKGCITSAETWEELQKMILDAKTLWLRVALEDRLVIPEPEPINL